MTTRSLLSSVVTVEEGVKDGTGGGVRVDADADEEEEGWLFRKRRAASAGVELVDRDAGVTKGVNACLDVDVSGRSARPSRGKGAISPSSLWNKARSGSENGFVLVLFAVDV